MSAAWIAAVSLGALSVTLMLYLLRPPARRLVVPSVLIWERVLRGSKQRSDRWRWWISLLLAGAIAALIAVPALSPVTGGAGGNEERTVLILDNSPTMAARTTAGTTRFDDARTEARRLLEALAPGTQVMVADTQRQISTPAFESRDSALALLAGLRVGHQSPAHIPEVAVSAQAGKRYVVSDGVLVGDLPSDAVEVSVFEAVENVGITAFDIEMIPGDPRRYQAFLRLANAGASEKQVTLEIVGSGAGKISRELTLPAAGSVSQAVDVSRFDGGPIRAALLAPGDALSVDDTAYGFLPMRRLIRITLVTPGSDYLSKSLAAQPRVRLTIVPAARFADRGDADIYVFDRFAPRVPPRAPAVLLAPGSAGWLPPIGRAVAEPELAGWDAAHPVLQNLSLRDLYIESATPARKGAEADSVVLMRTRAGDALALAHDGARRWLWLGFDLERSNFGLHAAFPAFLNNAIQWLVGETVVIRRQPGPVSIDLNAARVVAMDGSELAVSSFGGRLRFDAELPGIYTAVNADNRIRVAVNVLDEGVTRVNNSRLAPVSAGSAGSVPAYDMRAPVSLWMLLLILAAVLLIFEWFTYNRRVTL